MTQEIHTAGQQATVVRTRTGFGEHVSYASVWSIGCPTTDVMTAKPGIGAFADHANLPSRRPKESSP